MNAKKSSQFQFSLTPLWEVFKLNYTDGKLIPGLGHGPYLCVGVASDVILQNSVDITSNKTTCKYVFIMLLAHFILEIIIPYHLYENQMSIKYHYQIREPCYQCW